MSKEDLSRSEWICRQGLYANGEYVFGHGHAPPPNSQWAKKKTLIKACPVKKAHTDIHANSPGFLSFSLNLPVSRNAFWVIFGVILWHDILTMQLFQDVSRFLYSGGWQILQMSSVTKIMYCKYATQLMFQ